MRSEQFNHIEEVPSHDWIVDGRVVTLSRGWRAKMTQGNGQSDIKISEVSERTMIEILLEAVQQLTETVEDLKETQTELIEKISNMSTPGSDYGFDHDLELDLE